MNTNNPDMCCEVDEECSCVPRLAPSERVITTFVEGDALYCDMFEAIENASKEICFETYILAADSVGRAFVDALRKKVAEGVRVRLLVDSAGSHFWVSTDFETLLHQSGMEFRWFGRFQWAHPFHYNRRNHRKLLVVDRRLAFLGGFNIHKENSRREFGDGRIRDTHVRVGGDLAQEAYRQFDAIWTKEERFEDQQPEEGDAVLLSNIFRNCRRKFHCLYQDLLVEARQSVCLTTPYFVPDQKTQDALCAAAERGVEVSLLVPEKRDVRVVWWAARAAYAPLLASGVRIYEYLERPLHAKVATVDGTWGLVGSANLDYRSFFTNYEVCLLAAGSTFAEQLEHQFRADLIQSREVLENEWVRRPWSHRICETIGWLGRQWF